MTDATLIDILPRRAPNLASLKRWRGLGRNGASAIDGIDHLRQSIIDILTTYPGERIMRPEYGSRIRDLIDRPVNAQWLADLYFNVAQAITRWEPRVRVLRVAAAMPSSGHVTLDLTLRLGSEDPQTLSIEVSP
ncbi:GPW/gp25 family protein [Tepidiphilus succinatimandens]|uniref:GPW/gp25 family protein n=1 Tax=Tepidiphilus succinatimandens TaxID=224436 RepID=UPI00112F5FDD|nr:GPW/gp25 family protein [Tepidiphilus succinatimandens]